MYPVIVASFWVVQSPVQSFRPPWAISAMQTAQMCFELHATMAEAYSSFASTSEHSSIYGVTEMTLAQLVRG